MLCVAQLEKIDGGRTVLAIDSLQLADGEVLAVAGPGGSGKTLLIHLLGGLVPPSRGKVLLDGEDVHRSPSARSKIGIVFEEDLLYDRLSVRANVLMTCRLHAAPPRQAMEAIGLLGLDDQANTQVGKLPASRRRRVAIARALAIRPKLLLLDQPSLRTDFDTRELLSQLLRQRAAEGGITVIAEEDVSWAGKLCTQVVELAGGRVVARANASNAVGEQHVPYRIPGRRGDHIVFLDPADVLYITTQEGQTILRTDTDEAYTQMTLQELERRLAGRGFFRAHRAYLVNLQRVRSVVQYTRNSFTLQLDDPAGTMVPLSKQSERELQDLLGY